MPSTSENTLSFFVEKIALQRILTFFSTKNNNVFGNFNKSLTNYIVDFEQLGRGIYSSTQVLTKHCCLLISCGFVILSRVCCLWITCV